MVHERTNSLCDNYSEKPEFNIKYAKHYKFLKLRGMQPKTVDAYTRAIRRIGNHFEGKLDKLTQDQLLDYFHKLLDSHSWSAVKLDLYGLKFFYTYVLNKTWVINEFEDQYLSKYKASILPGHRKALSSQVRPLKLWR